MNIFDSLQKLMLESGFASFFTTDGGWKNLVMILIAFVLLYLGIVKKYEPLLLCGIGLRLPFVKPQLLCRAGENALYHPELVARSLTKQAHIITATAT